jgi:hypothetical protein
MPFRRLALAVAIATAPLAGGCASMHQQPDVPPHPITITVINNLMAPRDLTLYAVTTGGSVRLLGDIPPTDSTSLQMTPRSFSEPYRLLVQGIPRGMRLWSQEFTVRDANTGEIRWMLQPNILQFYDVADSTATSSTP